MGNKYLNIDLMRKYPNVYKIKPSDIPTLKVLNWSRLKEETWRNEAMTDGSWWCHLEGSQESGKQFHVYDDEDEFWIGFNEENNKIDYHFCAYGGMTGYEFDEFYKIEDIENKYDMNVQVNTVRWLTRMIKEGVLGFEAH